MSPAFSSSCRSQEPPWPTSMIGLPAAWPVLENHAGHGARFAGRISLSVVLEGASKRLNGQAFLGKNILANGARLSSIIGLDVVGLYCNFNPKLKAASFEKFFLDAKV